MSQIKELISLDIILQAFSQNEIISRIPPNILAEIKQKDEHPFFQIYSICHEGISKPKIEGKGYKPITWFREAIQSIKNVVKKGIKFFNGHNKSNDEQDKQVLGEVIHTFEEEIDDKLHYCTIGYFPPETREISKSMDICSQEAEWNLIDKAGQLIADTCQEITGIALAKSEDGFQPAFEDSKRLAFIQAFEDKFEGDSKKIGEGDSHMSYEEILKSCNRDTVKRLVSDLQLHPNQLFDEKGIREDRLVDEVFKKVENLEKQIKTKDDEINNFKTKNNELNRSIQLQNAKGKLSELYKTEKLTDNMKKFIDNIYEKNKEKIDDLSEEGLKKFVENQKEIFQLANADIKKQEEKEKIPSGDDKENDKNPFLEKEYNAEDYI